MCTPTDICCCCFEKSGNTFAQNTCGVVQLVTVIFQQLWSYERAHRQLAAQGIPRAPSGNPFAPDAPWKREDLHRVGQDDCEKLGGIFYFRILWFNVSTCAYTSLAYTSCSTSPLVSCAVYAIQCSDCDLAGSWHGWLAKAHGC